ncbi:MAG: hypothetical protein PHG69_06755, partial [Candidatus Omnitrophica bacterium]|nr:hypothetical protein [Candidatus Omnitrophota bacterium]
HKMSKSLGNFITIKDFMDKYKDADILKLFFLSAHYSHPVDFTDRKIDDANKMKERIAEFMDRTYSIVVKDVSAVKDKDFILRIKDEFIASMDDDFNTPRALSCIYDLIKETYKYIERSKSDSDYRGVINNAVSLIRDWSQIVFGLNFIGSKHMSGESEKGKRLWQFLSKDFAKDLSDEEFSLIQERTKARSDKDYAKSDKLRVELEKRGIIAKDTQEGSIYQRKT